MVLWCCWWRVYNDLVKYLSCLTSHGKVAEYLQREGMHFFGIPSLHPPKHPLLGPKRDELVSGGGTGPFSLLLNAAWIGLGRCGGLRKR